MSGKLLIVLLAVLAGVWLWRRGRRLARQAAAVRPPPRVQTMLRCHVCGTHVPESEAAHGAHGAYCSAAHRAQAGDTGHAGRA